MSLKTDWQAAALVLFGLLVGGGGATGLGHLSAQSLAIEAASERNKIEKKVDSYQEVSTKLLIELGKLGEKVDNLSSEVIRLRNRIER